MNYAETLDYLFTKLPMFTRVGPSAYKADIINIQKLCERLGNPHQEFKTIHVAGTNGKGSVSHMLAATLQVSGYKTGLYTSPHLYDFRERIKINGQMVPEEFVISFTERIKPLILEIEPSFFEITLAMAFSWFAEQQVDVAVIEVGLGGRLDSTNIITPELSIITNIGWDHMNLLGDSLQKIATEKAGIIKQEVPVVIGERQQEVEEIFMGMAEEKKAPFYFASDHYKVVHAKQTNKLTLSIEDTKKKEVQNITLDLPGFYQQKNVCTALQAINLLQQRGWKISQEDYLSALSKTKALTGLHGRWEILQEKPTVILEVAHNKEGLEQMVNNLALLSYHHLHIVFGIVKDKDATAILSLLPKEATYYFTQAHIPRALSAADLAIQASPFGLQGNTFTNVNTALEEAFKHASEDDVIIVCGSIFLVSEVNKEALVKCAL